MFIGFRLRTVGCGLATVDCELVPPAVPFLVAGFFRVWLHRRQFFERVHPPDAAGHEHCHAQVALPALQVFHPVVSEHSAGDMAGVARTLQKLRRAHLLALFRGRIAHGRGISKLLAGVRQRESPASVHAGGPGLRGFSRGTDRGNIH